METTPAMMAYIKATLEQAELVTTGHTKNMIQKSLGYAPKVQTALQNYEASRGEVD